MSDQRVVDPVTQQELMVPDWATSEQVSIRLVRHRSDSLRKFTMRPDSGSDWPLWEPGADAEGVQRGALPVSDQLADQLGAWQGAWSSASVFSDGWQNPKQHQDWLAWGQMLLERVRQELWAIGDVEPLF